MEMEIEEPVSIMTDRYLALINALDSLFPNTTHLICRWHVTMNIFAKTKRFFPGPQKDAQGRFRKHRKFQDFIKSWQKILKAKSKQVYNEKVDSMEKTAPGGDYQYVQKQPPYE